MERRWEKGITVASAKIGAFAIDALDSGIWFPAFVITIFNIGLFWALFADDRSTLTSPRLLTRISEQAVVISKKQGSDCRAIGQT